MKYAGILLIAALLTLCLGNCSANPAEPWAPYQKYLPDQAPQDKAHFRALWISTVSSLDWPKTKAVDEASRLAQQKELTDLLDRACELNMNAVIFQVRSQSDALYPSQFAPWGACLTGTLGRDPGYDPLQFAIEQAHLRNLEFHAWFNPYRVSTSLSDSTVNALKAAEKSVFNTHPEWVKTSASRYVLDPGIPAARQWVEECVLEAVQNYDIDAVHFDDYFYYESDASPLEDDDAFAAYGGEFQSKGDWRRNNTYLLVRELSEKLNAAKPYVKFGISPAGVWGNKSDHPEGSDTRAGLPNYDAAYADTKRWVEEELIDYIAPQVYWSFGLKAAPFGTVASWWAQTVKGKNVALYIGEAAYKVNDASLQESDPLFASNGMEELARQLTFNLARPEISGSILFSARNLNGPEYRLLPDALWKQKALVPVMDWKRGAKPRPPALEGVDFSQSGVTLRWTDTDPDTSYFAIYRFEAEETPDINKPGRLLATLRKTGAAQSFTDKSSPSRGSTYVVTSVGRLHQESEPAAYTLPNGILDQEGKPLTTAGLSAATAFRIQDGGLAHLPAMALYFNAAGRLVACESPAKTVLDGQLVFSGLHIPQDAARVKLYLLQGAQTKEFSSAV